MAAGLVLLYVTGTDAGTGITAIGINKSGARFRSTGDNAAISTYAGRIERTGTIVLEDTDSAETLIAAVAATKYFDTVTADGDLTARFTCTNFMVTSYSTNIGDGTTDGNVPDVTLNWVATDVAVGDVP